MERSRKVARLRKVGRRDRRVPFSLVLRDLAPLLVALTLAAVVYAFRERCRRRRRMSPKLPDLTMAEAWALWRDGVVVSADRELQDGSPVPHDDAGESVPAALLEAERLCTDSDHPRLAVRRLILDQAAMSLHLDAVLRLGEEDRKLLLEGYEPDMVPRLRAACLTSGVLQAVLRLYAQLKYDDAVARDWFHHFLHLARPYIRERVRVAREYVLSMDEGSGRIVEVYDRLLHDLRKEMIEARPKKRFAAPDLP